MPKLMYTGVIRTTDVTFPLQRLKVTKFQMYLFLVGVSLATSLSNGEQDTQQEHIQSDQLLQLKDRFHFHKENALKRFLFR